jgi:hypothetical protein
MAPSTPTGAMMAIKRKAKSKVETHDERPSAEDELGAQLQDRATSTAAANGKASLPAFEPQFRPLSSRKFRFDYACPPLRLAVEVDGGIWSRGAHIRPAGREADMLRDATLMLHGWRILRFSSKHVRSGLAIKIITAYVDSLTGYLSKEDLQQLTMEIKAATSKRKKNVTRRTSNKARKTEVKQVTVRRDNQRSPRSSK